MDVRPAPSANCPPGLSWRLPMLKEKQLLAAEDLERQFALELPEREMLGLITVVITNLLNNNTVTVDVKNNKVAVQVCAVVTAISSLVSTPLSCTISQ